VCFFFLLPHYVWDREKGQVTGRLFDTSLSSPSSHSFTNKQKSFYKNVSHEEETKIKKSSWLPGGHVDLKSNCYQVLGVGPHKFIVQHTRDV
jgi:hypothetical protein